MSLCFISTDTKGGVNPLQCSLTDIFGTVVGTTIRAYNFGARLGLWGDKEIISFKKDDFDDDENYDSVNTSSYSYSTSSIEYSNEDDEYKTMYIVETEPLSIEEEYKKYRHVIENLPHDTELKVLYKYGNYKQGLGSKDYESYSVNCIKELIPHNLKEKFDNIFIIQLAIETHIKIMEKQNYTVSKMEWNKDHTSCTISYISPDGQIFKADLAL
jgi:hypothetical protein